MSRCIMDFPKVIVVSRDGECNKALSIFFASRPTDDEMRAVHDYLNRRESAKTAVTDEIVRIASDARYVAITGDSPAPPNRCEESDAAMRAALEAVAPMLASARVPDGWQLVPIDPTSEMFDALCDTPMIIEGEVRGNTFIRKEHHDQRYIHDSWKAMLAAAPKPETEE